MSSDQNHSDLGGNGISGMTWLWNSPLYSPTRSLISHEFLMHELKKSVSK